MRLPARFRLKAFPDDKQLWKVDWFGDLLPNINAKSEPLLEVFIVPFTGDVIDQQTLKQKGSYDYKRFRKIKVGISLLPFLHLGTFWRNGIHQTASLSERFNLTELKIDADNTRVISAENFTAYEDLISLFPSIKRCPKTNLLEIDYPNNTKRKILIPSYEVIRTYYAGSSPLTRGIITGGIRSRRNALFDPTQTNLDETTGVGKLILRKKLAKSDRYNVARLAFSETAANAAWGIYSSIVKNFNNNERFIVEAAFPFVGETDLQVCGKWFKQGELWHLLVYFIESCDHSFPYQQLIWGIEGEKEINDDPKSGKEHLIRQTINKNEDDRDVESDDEPDLRSIFSEALFDGQKFPDLENKHKEQRLKSENTESGVHYKVVTEKTDESRDLSTGAGTFGASSKQGLVIKISEDEKPEQEIKETSNIIPAGWELFVGILDELEKKPQIKTNIISFLMESDVHSKSNIANGIYFPVLLNGKHMNWSYLDKMQTRRRQAMLAEILIGQRYFYLFDTEVKTDDINDRYSMMLIFNNDLTEIGESHWRMLLSDTAKFRGRKRNKWRWNKIKRQKFRHDLKDVEKYGERLFNFTISKTT